MPLASVTPFWRAEVALQAQKVARRPPTLSDQWMPPVPQLKVPRLATRHANPRSPLPMMEEAAPAEEEHPLPEPLGRPVRSRLKLMAAAGYSSTPGRSGPPMTPRTSRKSSLTVFLMPIQSCHDKISQIFNFCSRQKEQTGSAKA